MKYYALRHKDTKLYYLTNDSILNTLTKELSPYCLYTKKETINFYYLSLEYIRIESFSYGSYNSCFDKYETEGVDEYDDCHMYLIPSSEFEIVEFELIEILK